VPCERLCSLHGYKVSEIPRNSMILHTSDDTLYPFWILTMRW
jgi:hypothetical protein